ncbi:copper amine oxidase N-terminal domain-containing protein [Clostridium sp. 'deep sea']|uniref:copper amine oxidase N-terminal domain-containing protein n=1 Tax=Clostridium sp. 'deep sea' TaxID=2779445 RepID=UPI001896635C|nr:copper amine oxidase N-terminal domain-containing protein [Clostridium sp. 'deep sea']QOR34249.1 copper amine oxidase N-terminal domain-containing protein [Clostridium sp. 'deep sea']
MGEAKIEDAGKKMGEAKIEVLKPVVSMTGAKTITNGFNNKLEFQLIDPRDNSVMSNDVKVEVAGALVTYVPTFDQKAGETLDSNKEVWTGTYYTKEVDFEKAIKDEKELVADVIMDGDNSVDVKVLAIPIVEGTLTATPEHVIIGQATNITLTYTDGDGNPLADRIVKLNGDEVSKTDEDGKILYSSSATSSLALVFEAETDYDTDKVSKKVSSKADTEGPKVEVLSISKDGKSATLKITDNVRLHVTYINGELVEMKFPKADAIHVVTGLVPGINKVEFLSADTNFNYTEQTIEIEVEAPVIEKVEFTLNNAVGDLGTPVKIGTTSMVPARLVEELGVSFAWDAESQTVEYTYGETTVKLTVDSKTGIVNGENVPLSEAPYLNAQGRLMVPVRMVGQSLGFDVKWTSDDAPIIISK